MDTLPQTELVGDMAHQYTQAIIDIKHDIERSFLILGKLLYEVCEKKLYLAYGDSFAEYLAHPDINIKSSSGANLVRVYKTFQLEWGYEPARLAGIGITKLVLLLEKTNIDQETADEWLNTAKNLSRRDLLIELGAVQDVQYDGVIRGEMMQDEVGLVLHIRHGPDSIPVGIYRLSVLQDRFGQPVSLARITGRLV